MPIPLQGFDPVNDLQTDSLGWHVILNQQSFGGLLDVTNQSDLDFQLWANDTDYLGILPAWTAYIKIGFTGLYSYINFRPVGHIYAQQVVSQTISGSLYQLGEPAPATVTIALPRQTFPIRQTRSIAVPIGLAHWYNGTITLTTAASLSIATWLMSTGQINSRYAGIYLYAAWIDAAQAASVQTNSFAFSIQWRDISSVALGGPVDLYTGRVTVGTDHGDHASYQSAWPLALVGINAPNAPANAAKAELLLRVLASTGGNTSANFGVAAFMDADNAYRGDADIGFGNFWSPLSYEAAGRAYPFF